MKIRLLLFFVISIGLLYRLYGLGENLSFWSDENPVAIFTRTILEKRKPILSKGYFTKDQQLQYWLSAISAKIFGLNEFAIRFPSVIFGVLTIWVVYLLAKELFVNSSTSEESKPTSEVFIPLVAATLITFLKIEILWSRQARPYQALQFFFVLGAWFVYKLTKEEKFNWRYFSGFLICGILASLMHGLGLILFFNGFLYLLLFRFFWFKKWILPAILLALVFGYVFRVQIFSVFSSFGDINNFFYYRVFLWHNYSLLVFLALVGFLFQIFQKKKTWLILILFLAIQGFIVSFLLPQPFTRYIYLVFPFLVLLSAVGLGEIAKIISPKKRWLILVILVIFIVAMGNKFTLFPQKVYSLNEDMQEIPEVDWKKVYGFVGEKLKENPGAVLIANWNDSPVWYLGASPQAWGAI